MATIAIIGGGFSGTITAVHLLQRGLGSPGRLVIVNRSGAMARGVAYGTLSDHHVLNVPAGRMSAFDEDPDSFVRFVRARGVEVEGGTFVSRHLYGAYLEALLRDAAARATDTRLDRVIAEVREIERASDDTHAWITLHDGTRIRADRVVLAVGNYPPLDPPIADHDGIFASPRYVRDPWRPGAFATLDSHWPVLLMGTSLTMVDMVLELRALGFRGGCLAVSRRGLLPLAHRHPASPPADVSLPAALVGARHEDRHDGPDDHIHHDGATATVRAYVKALRQCVRDEAARGLDWRDVMAALRPVTARLWQSLSLTERRRFLRHVRPFWDVHRHRVAPQLHASFTSLLAAGDVTVMAARIVSLRETSDRLIVRLRPRGSKGIVEREVGTIVNCTGPAGDTRLLRDPLFERLQARGLLKVDSLGLGIETTATGAIVDEEGRASSTLYYVGPFLKARDWEATAVPELRQYARRLAEHLIASLEAKARPEAVRSGRLL